MCYFRGVKLAQYISKLSANPGNWVVAELVSWMSCAVTAAINLCTEGTKLSVGLQGKMSEPFSGRREQ